GGGGEAWMSGLRSRFGPVLGDRLRIEPPEFDPERLARRYGTFDIFCYPSVAERGETFGVSVAEAMASGCTPVVSALACFRDLVRDGETGLVFDHRAADAPRRLADALARLVGNAPLRARLGARAQDEVRRFDFARVGANILADLDGFA
ncbi:MAG: glycosyltransferase family 4 protein, partial [Opitutaceae bacterium]